jgi:DDE superfamily endonuclease
MRPGPTAPRSLAGLLAEFRPCFTAPTFQTFVGLVVGLIGQTRRRTVCGMLTGAGLDQVWHHSRAHRLFTHARWSGDALGLALADLIVTHLLPVGFQNAAHAAGQRLSAVASGSAGSPPCRRGSLSRRCRNTGPSPRSRSRR